MWHQRASYDQSNVLDVTIQCQLNIASKNMAEFSTVFAQPAHHQSPTGPDCPSTYYGHYTTTPTKHRAQCDYEGYQQPCSENRGTLNQPNNSHRYSNPAYNTVDCSAAPKFHPPTTSHVTNHFLDDSGYHSPSSRDRQHPVSMTSSASSSPLYYHAGDDFHQHKPRDLFHHQSVYNNNTLCVDTSVDQWIYSQCNNYGYNQQCHPRPELLTDNTTTPLRSETEDTCEDMKLALREKDITHRLFVAMETDKVAAEEVEQYYQSQTTLIDLERHNILCQMAYDRDSSASINKYYNKKLVTLLESVEQKLSVIETETKSSKTGTGKRCSGNQKKSRLLPKHAVKILESWYQENLENPYPSRDVTLTMASEGGITVEQIRKWFANKRNRSRNSKLKKGLLDCE